MFLLQRLCSLTFLTVNLPTSLIFWFCDSCLLAFGHIQNAPQTGQMHACVTIQCAQQQQQSMQDSKTRTVKESDFNSGVHHAKH